MNSGSLQAAAFMAALSFADGVASVAYINASPISARKFAGRPKRHKASRSVSYRARETQRMAPDYRALWLEANPGDRAKLERAEAKRQRKAARKL